MQALSTLTFFSLKTPILSFQVDKILSAVFLLFSLVPDVVDISHFEPGDKDGGQGDDIVGEVAPLTVNQALLNKVVDVFSELDHHLN